MRRLLLTALLLLLLATPARAEETIQGPTGGQMILGKEQGFGFGTLAPDPTALYGASRVPVVLPGNSSLSTISVPAYFSVKPAPNQRFLLEAEGDYTQFGLDMSYAVQPKTWVGVLTANAYLWRARILAFEEGRNYVGLLSPLGAHPWLYQAGGGLEYTVPVNPRLRLSSALNYRQFTVHHGAFTGQVTGQVPPFDQFLDPLTVDPDGTDEILSARLVGLFNTLDSLQFPTRGTKLRFGAEQTIPVGSARISSTRLQANVTQFIPLGKEQGPTLIFNLQGGGMWGDVPPYDAYSWGASIRCGDGRRARWAPEGRSWRARWNIVFRYRRAACSAPIWNIGAPCSSTTQTTLIPREPCWAARAWCAASRATGRASALDFTW